MAGVHEVLRKNRQDAVKLVQGAGIDRTRTLLKIAAKDLEKRLKRAEGLEARFGERKFTAGQMRAALAQVRDVTRGLAGGMKGTILNAGEDAAASAAEHTADYLEAADREYRGTGTTPLAINEATMLEAATGGARGSILRRLATSGEGEGDEEHPAKLGILERYGVETVGHFEGILQVGLVAKRSWGEMRDDITEASPFLQEAPAYWAERIVRTEVMGAYNKASQESIQEADEQLEDMCKIVVATFDERTGPDSYNVHGQCRYPDEAFEYVAYNGARELFVHPPNRPNDREVVVPYRVSWGKPPPEMRPLPTSAVKAAYDRKKVKFHGRPEQMSTVRFGRGE